MAASVRLRSPGTLRKVALIRDTDGQSFELVPVAYQFPTPDQSLRFDDDANWLQVRINLVTPALVWEREDPALYTWSFYGIGTWMRDVVAGRGEIGWYYPSVEPNLALAWEAASPRVCLRVLLSQEFSPLGSFTEHEVRFVVRPGALLRFADQLEADVKPFPIRTWGEDPATARIAKRYRQTMHQL